MSARHLVSLSFAALVAIAWSGCSSDGPAVGGALADAAGLDVALDSGGEAADDASSADGAAGDEDATDAAAVTDAAACGAETCGADQVCVHPCCGGAAPPCIALDDAGGCPSGFHYVSACSGPGAGGPACQANPCTPPAPFCAPLPAGCGGAASCACLPTDVCASSGSCGLASGRDVTCLCA